MVPSRSPNPVNFGEGKCFFDIEYKHKRSVHKRKLPYKCDATLMIIDRELCGVKWAGTLPKLKKRSYYLIRPSLLADQLVVCSLSAPHFDHAPK